VTKGLITHYKPRPEFARGGPVQFRQETCTDNSVVGLTTMRVFLNRVTQWEGRERRILCPKHCTSRGTKVALYDILLETSFWVRKKKLVLKKTTARITLSNKTNGVIDREACGENLFCPKGSLGHQRKGGRKRISRSLNLRKLRGRERSPPEVRG